MRNFLSMKLLMILFSAFSVITTFAQSKTVSGSITDDKGDVLSGATISVKNTSSNTTSNSLGVFTIDVPVGKILVVSYVGMKTEEVTIGKSEVYNITLTPLANTL